METWRELGAKGGWTSYFMIYIIYDSLKNKECFKRRKILPMN